MKVSMLCGAHYEGAAAHLNRPPVAPSVCDPAVAKQSFDHFLEYAAMADEFGFDWISVSEHHSSPLILSSSVMPLAGALTQIVKRARIALLGPLAPLSNPVRVAEEIAVLDQLSNGRMVVLPLRGTPNEFNVYGPVDGAKTQAMTREASRLIRKALSEPEPFAWEGEHYHFPRVAVWPRAIQQPHPPMYFSGNSLNSAIFAGRDHLGVCLSFHQPPVVADTVAKYRAEAAAAGWEPTPDHIVYRGFVVVADTDEKAAEMEAIFLPPPRRYLLKGPVPGPTDAFGAPRASAENVSGDSGPRRRLLEEVRPTAASAADGLVGRTSSSPGNAPVDDGHGPESDPVPFGAGRMLFSGSPDTVVKQIEDFHAATGVGVIDLLFSSGQNPSEDIKHSLELFGREVLPRIRDVGTELRQPAATGGAA